MSRAALMFLFWLTCHAGLLFMAYDQVLDWSAPKAFCIGTIYGVILWDELRDWLDVGITWLGKAVRA